MVKSQQLLGTSQTTGKFYSHEPYRSARKLAVCTARFSAISFGILGETSFVTMEACPHTPRFEVYFPNYKVLGHLPHRVVRLVLYFGPNVYCGSLQFGLD